MSGLFWSDVGLDVRGCYGVRTVQLQLQLQLSMMM